MSRAPLLVIAVGNPSRGDDALGPILLERLGGEADAVELLTDFQLQIEHALDVTARRAVLFVDAALPGTVNGAALTTIRADPRLAPASHALRPQAVLRVAAQLDRAVPPAWLLAIEGASFELGDGLSATAERHLEAALQLARDWLTRQRTALALEPADA